MRKIKDIEKEQWESNNKIRILEEEKQENIN